MNSVTSAGVFFWMKMAAGVFFVLVALWRRFCDCSLSPSLSVDGWVSRCACGELLCMKYVAYVHVWSDVW